ncbi:hypothetical protein Scep_008357 [Stephania cephalantha]|uniref:Uncharacterized protein n=1 Tax=Stephania cephalantha TaxID=152367 RepID=A0AAP0KCR7_9MAGN
MLVPLVRLWREQRKMEFRKRRVVVSLMKLKRINDEMDLAPFKLDIDELIGDFSKSNSRTLADMKKIWLSRKFSFIYEARPTTNVNVFMQSIYAHSIGELERLKILAIDAKKEDIKVAPALIKKMLDANLFLFGSVEINESSVAYRENEFEKMNKARLKAAYQKITSDASANTFIHMDLGKELDLEAVKKISGEYESAKDMAISEAEKVVDVETIKHISKRSKLIGHAVEKIVYDWNAQKKVFVEQNRSSQCPHQERNQVVCYEDPKTQNSRAEDEDEGDDPNNNDDALDYDDELQKELESLLW